MWRVGRGGGGKGGVILTCFTACRLLSGFQIMATNEKNMATEVEIRGTVLNFYKHDMSTQTSV